MGSSGRYCVIKGVSLKGLVGPIPSFLTLSFQPWGEKASQPWVPVMIQCHTIDPEATGQTRLKSTKLWTKNQTFLFSIWLPQVFCYSNRKLNNTALLKLYVDNSTALLLHFPKLQAQSSHENSFRQTQNEVCSRKHLASTPSTLKQRKSSL
jgi:hypothetical protein